MEEIRIGELIFRELTGNITKSELNELTTWKNASVKNRELYEYIRQPKNLLRWLKSREAGAAYAEEAKQKVFQLMDEYQGNVVVTWFKRPAYRRMSAAAIVILVSAAAVLYNYASKWSRLKSDLTAQSNVHPGGNKAILTLGNGQKILLDSAGAGILADQGGTKVSKVDSGLVAYNATDQNIKGNGEVLWNTVTTPAGGQYRVILPDGSKVWLNALSSLKFPTFFKNERKVELTGEGYFEIVPNVQAPFKVSASGINIDVLGTRFDVMAYPDEPDRKMTVLDGSVRVGTSLNSAVLTKDQQASIKADGAFSVVSDPASDESAAWVYGTFSFNRADLGTIMRQLARWYNVEVEYQGEIPVRSFYGEIGRNKELNDVLYMLARNHVHFKIEGNKIIVQP